MKKITLLIMLFAITIASAQETFEVNPWDQSDSDNINIVINQGDTVRWVWGVGNHDVASNDPDAPSDFGAPLTNQPGFEYEYTFTEVAVIDFFCTPHDFNMFGTITVNELLSVDDNFAANVNFSPNPVKDNMTISAPLEIDSYEIYNVLGTKVNQGNGTGMATSLDVSNLQSGMYFIKVNAGDLTTTKRMMKN